MDIKNFLLKNKFEILVFALICIFMLANLSNMRLWNDEAETAVLGRNTLLFGVPKVLDGKNLITNNGNDYNPDFVWTWSSWLHIYIASLSFMIFGFSTFSARIFFAAIGILSFFPIISLFKKISLNRLHYYLSVLSLLFFVPYYIYSRQSRYFALLIFLMPLLMVSLYGILFSKGKNLWFVWFIVSSVLLFHSNYLSFFVLMLPITIFLLWILIKNQLMRKKLFKKLALSYFTIFLFTFPWALYANIFNKAAGGSSLTNLITRKVYYVLHDINYTVPILLILFSAFFVLHKIRKFKQDDRQKIFFYFYHALIPLAILFFASFSNIRYLIGLFPLLISIILIPVVFFIRSEKYTLKIAGALILTLFLFTNIFYSAFFYAFVPIEDVLKAKCFASVPKNLDCDAWVEDTFITPKELKFPFFYYLYEITHDYNGPVEGVVDYLNSHGKKNSVVFANNEYFSIQFYTGMKVLNPYEYRNTDAVPDFIFVNFPNRRDIDSINYLVSYAESRGYAKVTLPYPDLPWDNREALWYHKYWTQPIKVPVTIYVKK